LEICKWLNIKKKIPLYVLSKIWLRFAETLYVIEERSENSNKNYAEIFALYVAGFLNAVYTEIELYENREYNRKNNSTLNQDNVSSSSEHFNSKLKTDNRYDEVLGSYSLKDSVSDYTFFDYIYECPLLNFKASYFDILQNILVESSENKSNKEKKKEMDFSKMTEKEQKDLIKGIQGWETYALITISNKLRSKGYSNVSDLLIKQLRLEMLS